MKPVTWLGDSLDRVRNFARDAKQEAGHQLWRVQAGEEPSSWKPMPSVGLGVNEIRIHAGGSVRVIYTAKFAEAVYVLHAFEKRSHKTGKPDLELARMRFRQLVHERRNR